MSTINKNYDLDNAQLINAGLTNASFELGSPAPWNKFNLASNVNLTTYTNASVAKGGSAYAEMNSSAANGSVGQDVAVAPQPGQSYSFSVWVRSADGSTVNGAVNLWGLGGTPENTSVPFTATGTWKLVTVPLDVRLAGHTTMRAEVYMSTINKNYDLDNASFSVGGAQE